MKYLNFIFCKVRSVLFFFIILMSEQTCYSSIQNIAPYSTQLDQYDFSMPAASTTSQDYLYNKNLDPNDLQAAERLTEESYISPEMQWAIVAFLGETKLTINKVTGAVQGIPTVASMLASINHQLEEQLPIDYAHKQAIKNALHAMLEATEIAIFVAQVEAAYHDPKFIFYQNVNTQLTTTLNDQKQAIQTALTGINAIVPFDQPTPESSYFSWIWGSNTAPVLEPSIMDTSTIIRVGHKDQNITIPAKHMPMIIKNNDFKEMTDAVQAANLLFKQCFIAQQHHVKDADRIQKIQINFHGHVSATNYIFTNFPDLYDKSKNSYPICEIAKKLVPQNQFRDELQSDPTSEQIQAHLLLLHIRQSIQTALFIANKKSSVNIGYKLPAYVTSYLDRIVSQLMQCDAELSALCKDPRYGATLEDTYRDEQWATITKVAAGIAITAIAGGVVYSYAPASAAATYLAQQASALVPTSISTGLGYAQNLAVATSSAVGLLNEFNKIKGNNDPVVKKIEGDLKLFSSQLSQGTSLASTSYSLATIGSSSGIFDAGNRLKNAYFVLTNPETLNLINYMRGTPKSKTQITLTPEQMLNGFTKLITDTTTQGNDVSNVINNSSTMLLQAKNVNPTDLINVLQKLEKKYEKENALEISIALHQTAENIANQSQINNEKQIPARSW
ncbi:MAG: hypothetical protein JO129_02040 [Candidatus Dependentiae bacterium]|nr:hypothetical protein [Candidatus Dependentiae bacterium]